MDATGALKFFIKMKISVGKRLKSIGNFELSNWNKMLLDHFILQLILYQNYLNLIFIKIFSLLCISSSILLTILHIFLL